MRKAIKSLLPIFGIFALGILLFSCPDEIIQKQQGKALVSFSVTDARTVLPQASLADVALYKLRGELDGAAETELAQFTPGGTILSLDPGVWNFTLNAYNKDDKHIFQGKVENKQIKLTGHNQVVFSLSPVKEGTGAIAITLNFPESAGITRIVAKSDTGLEEFTPIARGNFVYTKNEVAAGDYFITFELYRGDGLRVVVSELVLVRSNLCSSKTITLVGGDLKPLLTGTVRITRTGGVGETLTANTDSLDGVGPLSYQWSRGGVNISGANSDTYVLQAADVGYTITVTVTRDGYSGGVTSSTSDVIVSFDSVTADGSSSQFTTELTLTFSQAIPGLSADDITLSGGIQKGVLSGTGPVYTLPISGFTSGGILDLSVAKSGYVIIDSRKTVTIHVISVIFDSVTADGSDLQFTTELTLTFDQAIPGLSADDITITPSVSGQNITKGTLSGTGPVYTLSISGFTAGGPWFVSVAKSGYAISGPQTVTLNVIPVTFDSVTADGSSTQTSTTLTLTFNQAIPGLSADDITLSGVSGVQKGVLSGPNGSGSVSYTLPISGFSASGNLTARVSKSGYAISGSHAVIIYVRLIASVSISGTVEVGRTLTASHTYNGNGVLTYQWKRVGPGGSTTDVGTGGSYTVQSADVGSTIMVTLTISIYISPNEIRGSFDSIPTATVPPVLTGTVSITAVSGVVVGRTLTANTSNLGGSGGTISYQWRRGGVNISGANSDTYVLQAADVGNTITVTVTRSGYSGSVTSNSTSIVILPPLPGSITLNRTYAWPGESIGVDHTNLGGSGTISYQWRRDGTNISGANSSTYRVVNGDVGSFISVTVTRSGNSGSLTSPGIPITAGY